MESEGEARDGVREYADVRPPEALLHAPLEPLRRDRHPVHVLQCVVHDFGNVPVVVRLVVRVPFRQDFLAPFQVEDDVVVVHENLEPETAPFALVVHEHRRLLVVLHAEEYHGGGVLEDVVVVYLRAAHDRFHLPSLVGVQQRGDGVATVEGARAFVARVQDYEVLLD